MEIAIKPVVGGYMLLDLFIKGGPIMVLLLLCSCVAGYIIIERYWFLKEQTLDVRVILIEIKKDLLKLGKEKAIRKLKIRRTCIGRVVSESIKHSHLERNIFRDTIKEVSISEIERLEKNIPFLTAIITISPILGLMGTVLGIMDIFNVISGGYIGNPELLSKGIAEALITTVTGLGITIPCILLYHYFRNRVDMIVMGMEQCAYTITLFIQGNNSIKE